MTNIIIPIIDEEMLKAYQNAVKFTDVNLIVGVCENFASKVKGKNTTMKLFKNSAKKEEIINALQEYIVQGDVLVLRRSINEKDYANLKASKADIVISKENHSSFKKFFIKVWKKFMKYAFGLTFFNGDISCIYFKVNLFEVLKNANDLSFISRVNKFKGVLVDSISLSVVNFKTEYNKVKNNAMMCSFLALFLGTLAGLTACFALVSMNFLLSFVFVLAMVLTLVFFLISLGVYVMNIKIGQRSFEKAEIIKKEK